MKTYVVYYRVSTKDQSLGIDAQKEMVDRFLKEGDVVVREFTEKETGTRKKFRPILQEALTICKDTGATLLIAKLDRLARNVHFITSLKEAGIDFKAVDMPEADTLTINILASVAQNEAELISSRTKSALAVIKSKIKENGHYTSRKGNRIVYLGKPDNLTQEARMKGVEAVKQRKRVRNLQAIGIIRDKLEIYELKGEKPNLTEIATVLNERGIKTSQGKAFHAVQVKRLMEVA